MIESVEFLIGIVLGTAFLMGVFGGLVLWNLSKMRAEMKRGDI